MKTVSSKTKTLLFSGLMLLLLAPICIAQPTSNIEKNQGNSEQLNQLLTQIALEHMPHTFAEDKDWGGQDERWDGIEFRREGFKIETKRKKKLVNHGTWKKYSAQLLNPDQEFNIAVENFHETDDKKIGFDVRCMAHIQLSGRQSKWVKGIQLYSLSANGHARIELNVSIELDVKMDINQFPPDMVFDPVATHGKLTVREFRIDRVSKAGGEFAQQISKYARGVLDKKITEKEAELVSKLNKQFEKKRDKLRLSIADALKSKWADAAQPLLPDSVKQAISGPADK